MKLKVFDTELEAGRYIANIFEQCAAGCESPLFALATGSTVKEIYRCFIDDCDEGKADFSSVRTVNLDEYLGLPKTHDQSFAYFMNKNLFSKTNFKEENITLFDGAADTESEIRRITGFLNDNVVDVMILGLGTNGHIGFNEPDKRFEASPHAVTLAAETIKANSRFFDREEDVPRRAFTIGMRDVARSRKVVLAAYGAAKAQAVAQLFSDDGVDPMLPCSILKLISDSEVVVDRALAEAAGLKQGRI